MHIFHEENSILLLVKIVILFKKFPAYSTYSNSNSNIVTHSLCLAYHFFLLKIDFQKDTYRITVHSIIIIRIHQLNPWSENFFKSVTFKFYWIWSINSKCKVSFSLFFPFPLPDNRLYRIFLILINVQHKIYNINFAHIICWLLWNHTFHWFKINSQWLLQHFFQYRFELKILDWYI